VFADIPGDLSDPDSPFPFALPGPERFARAMSDLGVGPGTSVVAYAQESPMWAFRLWWLLRYFGFDDVRVLDRRSAIVASSGIRTQLGSAEHRTRELRRRATAGAARHQGRRHRAVGGNRMSRHALSSQAFRAQGRGAYSRPGRIPGSLSAPAHELVEPGTGCLRQRDELAHGLCDLLDVGPDVP